MDIATLAEQIRGMDRRQEERHRDTAARLQRIEDQVRATNGKVIRHDEQIRTLFTSLREVTATVISWMRRDQASPSPAPASAAAAPPPSSKDDDSRPYTKRDVLIFAAGGGAVVTAWKFVAIAVGLLLR